MSLSITGATNINQTQLSDIQANSAPNPVLKINGGSYLVSAKESTVPFTVTVNSTSEPAAQLNAGASGGHTKTSAQYRVTQCSDDDLYTPDNSPLMAGSEADEKHTAQQGADLNTRHYMMDTPRMIAAALGQREIAEQIFKQRPCPLTE